MARKRGRFADIIIQGRSEDDGSDSMTPEEILQQLPVEPEQQPKKRGRPTGRRSNPDYTQISAYIPMVLLHDVQDLLLQERRRKRLRSGVDVSGLVEKLLTDWVKQQRAE